MIVVAVNNACFDRRTDAMCYFVVDCIAHSEEIQEKKKKERSGSHSVIEIGIPVTDSANTV
jgi:hypothetical protein